MMWEKRRCRNSFMSAPVEVGHKLELRENKASSVDSYGYVVFTERGDVKTIDNSPNLTPGVEVEGELRVKMAATEAEAKKSSDVEELLKPFYDRANLAEERLSRLEALVAGKKDTGIEGLSPFSNEFQLNPRAANAEGLSDEVASCPNASKEIHILAERNTTLAAGNVKLATGLTDLAEEHSNLAATHAKKAEETAILSAENAKLAAINAKLEAENAKLQYRITHLVRALEAERKFESK
ncbi:hypothetical protein ACLOJK_000377 [Asimina triloba]